MCTVSVIAVGGPQRGVRIVCNRDELRTRAPATEPRWRTLAGGVRGVWPTDTKAGGTWLGASERGLVLSLLNYNPRNGLPTPLFPPRQSRGIIIPSLIGRESVAAVQEALRAMDFSLFPGFRLIGIDPPARTGVFPRVLEATWNGRELKVEMHGRGPICFASSGLGDHRVLARQELFRRMVIDAGATAEAQDEFHHHVWPAQPEISVLMSREDARTVSVTTVEVASQAAGIAVRMDYTPVVEPKLAMTGSAGRS